MLKIYNAALAKLGSNRLEQVEDMDEPGAVGGLCRLFLPQVLDLALDYAPWSFALARASLAPALSPPDDAGKSPGPYSFTLPDDLIRPVRLGPVRLGPVRLGPEEPGYPFSIEGERLFAPVPEAVLVYVRRAEDPEKWTPPFTQAVIAGLAAELCPAVLNDISRQEFYRQAFQSLLAYAAAADLNRQKFQPRPGEWLKSRY